MYTSSIIHKYGDTDNVARDVKTLAEIVNRQGVELLIDTVAEYTAKSANKMGLDAQDRANIIRSLTLKLNEALKERL
jgi:glycine cleavage system regulatory protein